MATQETGIPRREVDVLVHLSDHEAVPQPATFRCCPLGVQFYTPEEVEKYKVLEVKLQVPSPNNDMKEVLCSGVVVHCQEDGETGLYRIWVFFLDVPELVRNHLHCIAKESEFLCPFCENF